MPGEIIGRISRISRLGMGSVPRPAAQEDRQQKKKLLSVNSRFPEALCREQKNRPPESVRRGMGNARRLQAEKHRLEKAFRQIEAPGQTEAPGRERIFRQKELPGQERVFLRNEALRQEAPLRRESGSRQKSGSRKRLWLKSRLQKKIRRSR